MSGADGRERIPTPLGVELEIVSGGNGIEAVRFALDGRGRAPAPNFLTAAAAVQLREYFEGVRTDFDVPLAPFLPGGPGTDYRRRVWRALRAIPFGETRTYGELAAQVGGSARSIGGANGANALCVMVPCHRVVGCDGFGGYGGPGVRPGLRARMLEIKRRLLAFEAQVAAGRTAPQRLLAG